LPTLSNVEWLEWPDWLDAGVVALAFAIVSFWWLHARPGRIRVARPNAYIYASPRIIRLRLPLAFHNSGAAARIISDLRVCVETEGERGSLPWIATLPSMRRSGENVSNYATPFTVAGRGTREVLAEFGDGLGWTPEPSSRQKLRVEAKVHSSDRWRAVGRFEWWAPPPEAPVAELRPYRNAPEQDP
jgi:hypothetical protein